jgi:NAD+ kinase
MLAPGGRIRQDDGVTSVVLVVHPERSEALALAEKAAQWWTDRGHDVVIWDDEQPGPVDGDLAVSLGGDGTMLRTVHLTIGKQIPVLGVNLGRMGYLTEVDPSAIEAAFTRYLEGDYQIDERMMLDVVVDPAGGERASFAALNEAIVEKTAPGHTIRVEVAIGGQRFLTYVADGLLVCTPTGSTAYNLSARGPVVSPLLDAVVLTPIAPHLVFDRSLVLSPAEPLRITLLEGRDATLVLDGGTVLPLKAGAAVTCRAGTQRARLVTFGESSFHSILRSRFSLQDR